MKTDNLGWVVGSNPTCMECVVRSKKCQKVEEGEVLGPLNKKSLKWLFTNCQKISEHQIKLFLMVLVKKFCGLIRPPAPLRAKNLYSFWLKPHHG